MTDLMTKPPKKTSDKELTVLEHLEELRQRIIQMLLVVTVAAVAVYFFVDPLLEIILQPLQASGERVYFLSIPGAFLVKLKLAVLCGVIIGFPVLFWHSWAFTAPGLYDHEKKIVKKLLIPSAVLFLCGVSFAFFGIVPFAVKFFLQFQNAALRPLISVEEYISFVGGLVLAFGLAFQLPVLMVGLVYLGVLSTEVLRRGRPFVVVGIMVASAVLTPPDVVSQILLAIPMWGLFEGSLFVARLTELKKARNHEK